MIFFGVSHVAGIDLCRSSFPSKYILCIISPSKPTENRSAYFSCVIVLAYPDGNYKSFEGRVDGSIATQKTGKAGFGYDPIFIPTGFNRSFAEFNSDEKNKISHRGRALQKFIKYLTDNEGIL